VTFELWRGQDVLATAVSDTEGTVTFPDRVIDAFGTYTLVEVAWPNSYQDPADAGIPYEHTFTITQARAQEVISGDVVDALDDGITYSCDADTGELWVTLEKINYQKWNASVKKLNGATGKAVSGVTFELWRGQDVLATAVSDEEGTVTFPDRVIDAFGTYTLVEVAWPEGYQDPADAGIPYEHTFTITQARAQEVISGDVVDTDDGDITYSYDADTGELWVTLIKENFPKRPIVVEKYDADTASPIKDTEFEVLWYPVEILNGAIVNDLAGIAADDVAWQHFVPAKILVTDASGRAVFEGLNYGYYQLIETCPNPLYATYGESCEEAEKTPARFVKLDRTTADETQVFEDIAIQVSVEVYKHTISATTSALDARWAGLHSNVGNEEYIYRFGARSNSNVRVDEFVIVDDLTYVTLLGYRMTTVWTGTAPAGMDHDGYVALLYKTNLTGGDEIPRFAYHPLAANPYNPNNPDKQMYYSNEPRWRIWAEQLSATTAARLDVADLGLAEGEYIVGLKCVYGGVAKGFRAGERWTDTSTATPAEQSLGVLSLAALADTPTTRLYDWRYAVVATTALATVDEMGNETVMRGSVSASLSRNIDPISGIPVLIDNDVDQVETRVADSFTIPTRSWGLTAGKDSQVVGSKRFGLPLTGTSPEGWLYAALVLFALGTAAIIAAVKIRRTKREGQR
jgi:hypothetical protein